MAAPEPEGGKGAEGVDELLVELLTLQSRGDQDAVLRLLERAGERADALRDALALTTELEDLGRLLGDEPGGLPDEIARLGRFEDLRPIADGGLARVYRARDPRLERDVALKVLHPDHAGADVARDWILAEGRALAGLQHDSVVRVFEVDEADGLAYVAMELVEGPNLHDVVCALRELDRADVAERHGPRTIEVARSLAPAAARLRLARDLADALESCHLRGVVHRDVKPANVLIDPEGTPKLIDFGLAHRVEASTLGLTQQLVGTPGYLAPEQVENDSTGASPCSDQFSLGTVLYELLTLRHPFQGESRAATMHAVAQAAPTPPRRVDGGITVDVERVCLHALERDPPDRYPSLAALRDDLNALLELRAISLTPDTVWRRAGRWSRRHVRALATGAVVGLILVTFALVQGARARRDVLGAVIGLRERISPAESAGHVRPLYGELIRHLDRATELDAASLGRMIHGAVRPAVTEAARELATRSGELIEGEVSAMRSSAAVEEQKDALHALVLRWFGPISSEKVLLGDSAPNAARLARGSATVPAGCEVWRLTSARDAFQAAAPLLEEEDRRSLTVGDYRVVDRTGGQLLEAEFTVEAWNRAREVRPRVYRCALPRVVLESPPAFSLGETHQLEMAPFELTAEPLRWRDVRAALGAEECERLMGRERSPDDFVEGTWYQAAEIALRMGARLPTPLELHVLRAREIVTLEGALWTSVRARDAPSGSERLYYDSSEAAPLPGDFVPDLGPWVRAIVPDGHRAGGAPRVHLARSIGLEPTRVSRR